MIKMKMNYMLAFAIFSLYSSWLTILGTYGVIAVKNLQQKVDHTHISEFAALQSPIGGSLTFVVASSGFYTGPYIGVTGDITLWSPHVGQPDYSANVVGCWKRDDNNQITVMLLAGYGVYPSIFGDDKNRIFLASQVYNSKCINDAACMGFVPISSKYKIGDIIEDISSYGDPENQKAIKVSIKKEDKWYISFNYERIGYFKEEALSSITDCDEIAWGGMVGSTGTAGSPTQMGNGRFPSEGYSKSGAIAQAHGIKKDGNLTSGRPFVITLDKPKCYDIKINNDPSPDSNYNFLYGGPGC